MFGSQGNLMVFGLFLNVRMLCPILEGIFGYLGILQIWYWILFLFILQSVVLLFLNWFQIFHLMCQLCLHLVQHKISLAGFILIWELKYHHHDLLRWFREFIKLVIPLYVLNDNTALELLHVVEKEVAKENATTSSRTSKKKQKPNYWTHKTENWLWTSSWPRFLHLLWLVLYWRLVLEP